MVKIVKNCSPEISPVQVSPIKPPVNASVIRLFTSINFANFSFILSHLSLYVLSHNINQASSKCSCHCPYHCVKDCSFHTAPLLCRCRFQFCQPVPLLSLYLNHSLHVQCQFLNRQNQFLYGLTLLFLFLHAVFQGFYLLVVIFQLYCNVRLVHNGTSNLYYFSAIISCFCASVIHPLITALAKPTAVSFPETYNLFNLSYIFYPSKLATTNASTVAFNSETSFLVSSSSARTSPVTSSIITTVAVTS